MVDIFIGVQFPEIVMANAKNLGLDAIDSSLVYHLKKSQAKKRSSRGYPDSFSVLKGNVQLIGDEKYVWLYVEGHGLHGWYKTSPIVKCTQVGNNFEIETENSLYLLELEYESTK